MKPQMLVPCSDKDTAANLFECCCQPLNSMATHQKQHGQKSCGLVTIACCASIHKTALSALHVVVEDEQ